MCKYLWRFRTDDFVICYCFGFPVAETFTNGIDTGFSSYAAYAVFEQMSKYTKVSIKLWNENAQEKYISILTRISNINYLPTTI